MHSDRLARRQEKTNLPQKLPQQVTHPKVGPRQLLRVKNRDLWSCLRPSWLRASLTVDLLAAGYVKNPYDKCLFTLFSSDETSEGQLLLDVDDFIEGSNEIHRKRTWRDSMTNIVVVVGKSQFIASRIPDIAFATNRLARSLASKRLLFYLCGTLNLCLKLQIHKKMRARP